MKNLFLICVLLISTSDLMSQTSPNCIKAKSSHGVSGKSSFSYNPNINENNVVPFKGTISWRLYWSLAQRWYLISELDYSLGNQFISDDVRYTATEIGEDAINKIKINKDPTSQKGLLYFDIYVGGKFIKSIAATCNNYNNVGWGGERWSALEQNFSEEQICELINTGFVINISKAENFSFSETYHAVAAIKNYKKEKAYNEKIKLADEFYKSLKYEDARLAYIEAIKIKNDKYAKDKLAEIDQILQQKRQEQFISTESKTDETGSEKKTNAAPKSQNEQQEKPMDYGEKLEAQRPSLTPQQRFKQEEEKRKKEEFNTAKKTYEQSIARTNQIEQQSIAIQNTITNSVNSTFAANKAYNRYKNEMSKVLTMPKTTNPQQILNAYELKIEEANRLHEQRRKELDANLERIVQEEKNKANNELQKSTSEIIGIATQMMNNNAIDKAKAQSALELKELKENSLNEIKNDIQKSNRLSYENYTKLAASELKEKDESIYLHMASYHLCVIQSIENNFSYNHSNWIKTNCIMPKVTKPQENKYSPDAMELYETAVRKSKKTDDPFFKKSTWDYIDLAIEADPNNAELYYFKSTVVENIYTKISLLKLALEKDLSHKMAKEDLRFYSAKSALNLADMYSFKNDYPNSTHRSEATSIINYLEDIKTLEGLLTSKKILEANSLHEKVKRHPLYTRNQIKNLEMLNRMEEEICFKKALQYDTKTNKPKVRKSYYSEYLTKYPYGMYKDTAELRIKYLDMSINGYNLIISSGFNIGNLKTNTDTVTMSGGEISLSSYLFLYKNPISKFPRLDLEIFAGINFNGGTNTTDQIRKDSISYYADVENKNRITFMKAGLQLWFGKMVGVSLSYNGINLKRSVYGDLHSSWKDINGQSRETIYKDKKLFDDVTKIRKLAPGFSIAPINNEKYMVKFAYNQIKYAEDEGEYYGTYYGVPMYASPKIDLLVRNFELGGHVILQDANKKYVIGAWYKASRIKNNAPTGNKYEYSNDKLDYFQISFGFKF